MSKGLCWDLTAKDLDYVFRQAIGYFTMPWDGLRDFGVRILIPVVFSAMAH